VQATGRLEGAGVLGAAVSRDDRPVRDEDARNEDRLGEQLSVVWELEVGHTVTPAQGLPDVIHANGFDDPARPTGAGRIPVNVDNGTRRNAAFAYLDPARGRPNLTVRADTLVDRIALEGLGQPVRSPLPGRESTRTRSS
jgi:choline dehydrogenase-like flavoprotein